MNRWKSSPFFLLAALVAFLSLPTLGGYFQSDDVTIVSRSATDSWGDWARLFAGHWFDHPHYYRPLQQWAFALDRELWGLRPMGYRLTNALIYFLCVWLVYLMGLRALGRKASALGMAALFALFPANVFVLSWIAGKGISLAGLAVLFSLWSYWKAADEGNRFLYAASLTSFLGGLLVRESAMALPLMLPAVELLRRRSRTDNSWTSFARLYSGYAAVALGYLALRHAMLGGLYLTNPVYSPSIVGTGKALAKYALFLVVPPAWEWKMWLRTAPWGFAGLLAAAAVVFFVTAARGRNKVAGTGLLLAALSLIPSRDGYYVWNLFLPSIGWALALTAWAGDGGRWRRWAWGVFFVVQITGAASFINDWTYAGRLTRTLLEDGAQAARNSTKPLLALTLPSQYRQGHVLPYGFQAGLTFFGQSTTADVLTGVCLTRKGESVRVEETPAGYALRVTEPESYFEFPSRLEWITQTMAVAPGVVVKLNGADAEILETNRRGKPSRILLRLSPSVRSSHRIVSYSHGHLQIL